jgi:hypothetical protein
MLAAQVQEVAALAAPLLAVAAGYLLVAGLMMALPREAMAVRLAVAEEQPKE